jgi:hypothetical protein
VSFAANGEKHFIQVPLVTGSRLSAPKLIRILLPKLVVAAQDITHRAGIDVEAKVRQNPLNAVVAPGRVFLCHPHDELLDLLGHVWPPRLLAISAPVTLLGDQLDAISFVKG